MVHPLRKVLEDRGISQTFIARQAGVTPQYVNQVLTGKLAPSPRFRRRTAEVLEVPEHLLFPGEQEVVA